MYSKKLIYLPLEPYVERYTYLMSKPGGWAESHFDNLGVDFIRVEGGSTSGSINTGSVVDAYSRSLWAMEQTKRVVSMIESGAITNEDVIYTEDFWHPGIESLFYIRDVAGLKFKIGCFMHAQSIDDSDFTASMRPWIGDIERGMSKGYDFVFVTSLILRQLAVDAGWDDDRLFLTGLPFNLNSLVEEYGLLLKQEKERFVLFSSRFDLEKNPSFFMDLVERCPDINFKLVKPRAKLSNCKEIEKRAFALTDSVANFEIVDTSSKIKYYDLLSRAEVQFNCAIQDWVSWTLLEAITFKCKPLYPRWKDFPFELKDQQESLYDNQDLEDAELKLRALISRPFDKSLENITFRHDCSWAKKLGIMGLA